MNIVYCLLKCNAFLNAGASRT